MEELMLKILNFFGFAYWVEIRTDLPRCTYYFGPFINKQEATSAQQGYLEDLQYEGAQGVKVVIKRCKPDVLTVFDEVEDFQPFNRLSQLRNQMS